MGIGMINISLNQEELTALAGLLDAGVKATGLQWVKHAADILLKLETAVAAKNDKKTDAALT